jgi:UDP-N-acetylglucosamine acyltransferase
MPVDPSASVAATARIHPDAVVGPGVRIGEYCVVEQDVVIGAACVFEPYVYVKRWTTLGERNEISAGTVLGTDPLDKAFTGERSYLRIGNGNKIREHYTVSRGTKPETVTELGDGNYIMTSGHIAHNCRIGNNVVIASCSLVAGYVDIEDGAFVSGGVSIHQFSKIGRLAMIAGMTRVNMDAPPYFTYAGLYIEPRGVNLVGLRRAGFGREDVAAIKCAYRLLYRSGLNLEQAVGEIHRIPNEHARQVAAFVQASKRGIARKRAPEEPEADE